MASYGQGPYGQTAFGGTQTATPVDSFQGFVTGAVTATTSGVVLPAELIPPAAGRAGLLTLMNTGAASVTVTGPSSGPFALPPNKAVVVELPPGRFVVSTAFGTAPVSYAYAGR